MGKCNNKELIILNVYIHSPYECQQNEDEYLNRFAFISCCFNDNQFASVFVVEDMNADLTDKSSIFAKYTLQ